MSPSTNVGIEDVGARPPGKPFLAGDGPELVSIFGVRIKNVTLEQAVDQLDERMATHTSQIVYFVNADCFNKTAQLPAYHNVLKNPAAWIYGDGIGVRVAGQISRQPICDNVNGTDLFLPLCQRCEEKQYKIFLLGARQGRAEQVAEKLLQVLPKLQIAGVHHGYFDHDNCADVIDQINQSGADLLFVAFGAPYQEQWIDRYHSQLKPSVVMGVGGLFDFFSGNMPRAPIWVRKLTLEWAYRLAQEPKRMWKRYLIGNWTFLGRAIWWTLSGKN